MRVSIVATVRDEGARAEEWLSSLLHQTRAPDEIVVVDGGSTDGTLAILERATAEAPSVRVVHAPGSTISQGRNIAMATATGDVLAVTDAGTRVEPDWLAALVEPLERDPAVAAAGGFFRPGGDTLFERCLGAVTTPHLAEIDPRTFLPSSRSFAVRREWWERVGGYPEWLLHCEDLVFDLDLRAAGATMAFAPGAVVTWQPRPTLAAFARQYFRYSRGDGHALLWPKRHALRYAAYAAGPALLAGGRRRPALWVVLALGLSGYLGRSYRRLLRHHPHGGAAEAVAMAALTPAIVVTGDVAKMIGYPVGRWQRRCAGGTEGLARRVAERHPRRAAVGLR